MKVKKEDKYKKAKEERQAKREMNPEEMNGTKTKTKKEKKSKQNKEPETAEANVAEQWNVGGLEGGASRQSKFMRLLGGNKSGGALANTTNTKSDSIKAEADIQRQFEEGMKAKFDGVSQRRGLGA